MKGTMTVGELKKIIEDGEYSDDTPIVLKSHLVNGEVIGLQLYPVETTLSDEAIILQYNPYETMEYRDL